MSALYSCTVLWRSLSLCCVSDSSPKVHRCHVEVQCWELLWGKKFQVVVCELGREPPELLEALVLGAAVDISTPVLPKQQPSAPDSTRPVPASSASKGAGETRAPRSVTATRVGAPGAGAGAGAAAAAAAAGVDTTDAAAGGGGGSPAGAPVVPSVVTGAVPVGDDFNSSAPQRGGRGGGGVDGIRQAGARGRNTVRLSPAHAQQSTSPKLVAAVETSQPQQPQQPPKSEQADALRLNNFASVVPTVGSSLGEFVFVFAVRWMVAAQRCVPDPVDGTASQRSQPAGEHHPR